MRMFAMIGASDRYREQVIEESVEQGLEEIVIPVLPYTEFTWTTEPTNDRWTGYFKEFYGIPEETDLIFQ